MEEKSVTEAKCPRCEKVVSIPSYNDGKCPECGLKYKWQAVGIENAEHNDGPHDYIHWDRFPR